MKTSDFNYELPDSFIDQTPVEPRDSSRLMVLNRKTGHLEHRIFREIVDYLNPGDLLVVNQTRVIPARLPARKETGGKAEILLEKLTDPERYQTVYAKTPGSAAAPTAGLHFTPRLMDELRAKGIQFGEVTLHVGLDTFAPVTEDDPAEHQIHTEWCELSPETAAKINATKQAGGRVIGVGTTSVRTLESAANVARDVIPRNGGRRDNIPPYSGPTSIFILPGYQYKVVDAIITNFHLPKSTLIMMISAFAGRETVLNAYETAKREGYRFFSFGDAMFIL